MATANKVKTVSEYRARFSDPSSNNIHTVTSETLESLQKDVRHILGNPTQFEQGTDKNSYVITLRDQPLGWISQYELPESMSIKTINSLAMSKVA